MKLQSIATIKVIDQIEYQSACVIIRKYGDNTILCISLESNGDIEVAIPKKETKEVIDALRISLGLNDE